MDTKVETVWAKSVLHGEAKWIPADEAYDRMSVDYVDWCKELAVLYKEGTATQEEIATRYEKKRESIAYAIAVGNDQRIVSGAYELPKAAHTLYLLTTLPDDGFEELCKPDTKREAILEYKRRLKGIVLPPTDGDGFVEAMTAAPEFAERPKCPGPGYKYDPINREWYLVEPEPAQFKPEAPKSTVEDDLKKALATPYLDKYDAAERELESAFSTIIRTNTDESRQLIKRFLSSCFHPDNGKIRKDGLRMANINHALTTMERFTK